MSEAAEQMKAIPLLLQGRRKAAGPVQTDTGMPPVTPIENGSGKGLNAINPVTQSSEVQSAAEHLDRRDLAATITEIVALQKQRRFCIKSQSRCDRSVEAFLARQLGFHNDLPEKERSDIWKRVSAFRRNVEKSGLGQAQADDHRSGALPNLAGGKVQHSCENHGDVDLSASAVLIVFSAQARKAWDTHRANVEKKMRRLARSLPVWSWVESVSGFGDLGLAIVIGETGDLSGYATKERVWKRLGLAVIEGERQRKVGGEAALAHGYNPARRAEVWTIVDSMFRHQWAGSTDDVPARPKGPFGEVYARRKEHTGTREWRLKHQDNDARRVMGKALLESLWKEWRGVRTGMDNRRAVPLSSPPRNAA